MFSGAVQRLPLAQADGALACLPPDLFTDDRMRSTGDPLPCSMATPWSWSMCSVTSCRAAVSPCRAVIVSKATSRSKDAYSGFEGTALDMLLRQAKVRRIFVVGCFCLGP